MWRRQPAKDDVKRRVIKKFLRSARPSLSLAQICAIMRRDNDSEVYDALCELRDEGLFACTSGQWWMRGKDRS